MNTTGQRRSIVQRLPAGPNATSPSRMVLEFHAAFGLPWSEKPSSDVNPSLGALRVALLGEEVEEFAEATANHDLVGIADALADIVYVAYGAAATYGIDLDAVLSEVHRANMSKLGPDGRPILRADGKVMKGENYLQPDVARVLESQGPLEVHGQPYGLSERAAQ